MADRYLTIAALMLALLLAPSAVAVEARVTNAKSIADAGDKTDKARPKPGAKNAKPRVERDAELAATTLVDSHLPELKSVLKHLRAEQPRQYNLAIRDLAKSAKRLEVAKNRDEELYDIEVELLQAHSAATLLTAKLKVRDDEPDRKHLRAAAERLRNAEVARAKYDIRMYQERLNKTQQLLDAANKRLATKQDEDQLEKSYLSFLRKAGRQLGRKPSSKKRK